MLIKLVKLDLSLVRQALTTNSNITDCLIDLLVQNYSRSGHNLTYKNLCTVIKNILENKHYIELTDSVTKWSSNHQNLITARIYSYSFTTLPNTKL